MSSQPNVPALLVINIPTHARQMISLARTLRESGRYNPVLVFYPASGFDSFRDEVANLGCDVLLMGDADFYLFSASDEAPFVDSPPTNPSAKKNSTMTELQSKGVLNRGRWNSLRARYPGLARSRFAEKAARACAIWISRIINRITFTAALLECALLKRQLQPGKTFQKIPGVKLTHWVMTQFSKYWNAEDSIACRMFPLKRPYQTIERIFEQLRPAIVVLPEDNFYYCSHFFIKHANDRKTPSLIVPFTIVNTKEWAEARWQDRAYRVMFGVNWLMAKLFPKWVINYRGHRLILPKEHILICESLGITPSNPWLINSGHATKIAAESRFMADYYVAAGIPQEKLELTGALYDDILYEARQHRTQGRAELQRSHGVRPDRPLVLLALPPNQVAVEPRPGFQFLNYREMVDLMVRTLAERRERFEVGVNLHPRIARSDVVDIMEKYGVPIIDQPIEQLVPLSDLYIATASATIRLAINCGIPVVNYDAYRYDYDDYKGLEGVIIVDDKAEFVSIYDRLTSEPEFYELIASAQRKTAERFALLDGRSHERMLALFDRLAGPRQDVDDRPMRVSMIGN